jgi:hypothetical protein
MKIDYQSFTSEHLNEVLTSAMKATLNALVADGVLTNEQATHWGERHACVQATKRGWMSGWLEKFFPDLEDNQAVVMVVRPVHSRSA